MDSKGHILQAIGEATAQFPPLPDLDGVGIEYDDVRAQFHTSLTLVGGQGIDVAGRDRLPAAVAALQEAQGAQRIYSAVPEAIASTIDLDTVAEPAELNQLDLAVFPGEWAVAENAAVWVTDAGLRHRVTYFIAEHLVLVVSATQLLHNMHQAYRQLSFDGPAYGVFISGPSKTADIEQSLVIGAQGPRSLHVFLVD